ncbi:MAG: Gfo/Idh/MocA family oxidoreductase [Emcibacteraceae bacterium]
MTLLVGAGTMAIDYSKVLTALNRDYLVIGRSKESALKFERETGKRVICGGIDEFLLRDEPVPNSAIVSVGIEQLASTTKSLIRAGIKHILLEKPGGLNIEEINSLTQEVNECEAKVYIAYNRRFYSSVLEAQKIIKEDGGVENFTFEVTEWAHTIEPLIKAEGVKENWFLGNTTHVLDLAFYLGGRPQEIVCFTKGNTPWHSRSAIYSGAGETADGALFSYTGNWNAPGRWGVEMLTRKHRLIFRPIEKLQIQKLGSIEIDELTIDNSLDILFKPGLYRQVQDFLLNETENFCTLQEHLDHCKVYNKIANY